MKFIFALLILCGLAFSVFAQEKRVNSSPQAFQAFFAKFKNAVKKNDKAAIISMTFFPFKYGFDAGDEGKMTKTQFLKAYDKRFAAFFKDALKEENPLFSIGEKDMYVVSTVDAAHLSFIKSGADFKFVSYIVEP